MIYHTAQSGDGEVQQNTREDGGVEEQTNDCEVVHDEAGSDFENEEQNGIGVEEEDIGDQESSLEMLLENRLEIKVMRTVETTFGMMILFRIHCLLMMMMKKFQSVGKRSQTQRDVKSFCIWGRHMDVHPILKQLSLGVHSEKDRT